MDLTPIGKEATRPPTPPHHPIYGVHMSPGAIRLIVASTHPHAELSSVRQLQAGESFNNRIYFLGLEQHGASGYRGDLVLKVMGRFWGAEKVQNEAACLWLLESHCPDVPSPRIVAWSETGEEAVVVSSDRTSCHRV